MRLSSYTVLSDELSGGGYTLMNTISGSLTIVSTPVGWAIAQYKRDPCPSGEAALIAAMGAELRQDLLDGGHLTELSHAEERGLVVSLADLMHEEMTLRPSIMIVPNLDCNYRCTYCFERPLQNALKSESAAISHLKGTAVMTERQVTAIYGAIGEIRAKDRRAAASQIILYGGEPLDRNNEAVVREIVRQGKARGHFFAAITNGHDLDAFVDLLGSGGIEQVQISIDGPKRVHDKRRIYIGRESSFDTLVRNIHLALAESDAQIQVRVHVDPKNIGDFEEAIAFFEAQGWMNNDRVILYANTVYEKDKDGVVVTGLDQMEIVRIVSAICERYSNLFTSAPAVNSRSVLDPAFTEGKRAQLRGSYCAANSGNYIFAPDWGVYACWESVGKACSRIASYRADGALAFDEAKRDRWFKRSIATLPSCQDCAYALVCGGGCAQYAEYETGDLYSSYCDEFQGMFRAALADRTDHFLSTAVVAEEEPAAEPA